MIIMILVPTSTPTIANTMMRIIIWVMLLPLVKSFGNTATSIIVVAVVTTDIFALDNPSKRTKSNITQYTIVFANKCATTSLEVTCGIVF